MTVHSKSCDCDVCQIKRLDAFKEALKPEHAATPTREETRGYLLNPLYMGMPERLPKGKRGKQTKKTQYDIAHELRKGVYHRLFRLPESGNAANLDRGEKTSSLINQALEKLVLENPWLKHSDNHEHLNLMLRQTLKEQGLNLHRSTLWLHLKNHPLLKFDT